MRFLMILTALLPSVVSAQVFSSVVEEQIKGSEAGDVRMAGLSGDGNFAFVTSMSNKGLVRVSLADGERVTVTDEDGAGVAPVVSSDGQTVLHCNDVIGEDKLRRTGVVFHDIASGKEVRVTEPVRELGSYTLSGSMAEVNADGGTVRRKVVAKDRVGEKRPSVTCSDLKLQVTVDGVTTTLTPNGDGEDVNYIWASVSPDGKRILYYVSTEGTYVCDLNGDNVQYVGFDCLAPQWYDDNTVVGMKEKDSDLFITSSAIVAYTLDGQRQQLTSDDDVLLFPFCSAEAGRIVCTRGNGEMVLLKVEKCNEQ